MAIAIDATVAGITSNSYVTISEANEELQYRFDATVWNDVATTDADKTIALVMACRKIDSKTFCGTKYSLEQALSFPRYLKDTVRRITDDLVVRDDSLPVMPKDLKLAQILEANEILNRKDTFVYNRQTRERIIREGVQWIQIGETYERYNKEYVSEFYSIEAETLLSGLIRRGF